jgi:disulfide oxidoreductase YuzD
MYQSVLVCISLYQSVSVCISLYQHVSVCISLYQSVSVCISHISCVCLNQCLSRPTLNWLQSNLSIKYFEFFFSVA